MTAVLHRDEARLRLLIDDLKHLFPIVLSNARARATTKRRPKVNR